MKHLDYEDIHSSWLYCFTNPVEIGTRVSLSHRQPYVHRQGNVGEMKDIDVEGQIVAQKTGKGPGEDKDVVGSMEILLRKYQGTIK